MAHRKVQNVIEAQAKSRRSDYGSYKVTDRDWEGLSLAADMKFVRFDTLGEYWAPGFETANNKSQTLEAKDERLRNHERAYQPALA